MSRPRRGLRSPSIRHRRDRHGILYFVDRVRDEQAGHRVLLSAQLREVKLPKVFEAGSGVEHPHRLRLPALAGAVVHDGHTSFNSVNQDLRVGDRLSMMGDHEYIDRTDRIVRSHELELSVDGQVAQVEDTELAETGENAYRLCIFTVVFGLRDEIGAVAIRSAAIWQRTVDDPLRGR